MASAIVCSYIKIRTRGKICKHGSIRNSDDNVETAGFCPKVRDNLAIPIPPNPNPQLTKFWCQKGHNDTIGRFPLKYEEVIYTEPVMEENKQWCGIRDSPNILTYTKWSINGDKRPSAISTALVECELCTGGNITVKI